MPDVELRARVNLSYAAAAEDPVLAYKVARDGVDLARRLGMRGFGYYLLGNAADMALRLGEWEWATPELEEAVGRLGRRHGGQDAAGRIFEGCAARMSRLSSRPWPRRSPS